MTDMTGGVTLLRPDARNDARSSGRSSQGLPRDLMRQAMPRLRVLALLYAGVFFLAAFFPSLLSATDRAIVFGSVVHWLPGVVSIGVALGVAGVLTSARISPSTATTTAVVFEVVSSYGIAAAEFLQVRGLDFRNVTWIGLSWVAVWMLLFTIIVPTSPRRSVLVALGAASAVPVMVALSFRLFPPPVVPGPGMFFFAFVFPYLLAVGMAYVGARVLFALGNEVRKARELGSYVLLKQLGQGGMGEVWSARHRLLARPAAIKLIRMPATVSDVDTGSESRFEREAQAIASLRSPHTVDLFDFGIAEDGTFYYVMELLDGLDAERIVSRFGPMPAERVVHVIRQVCHSLSEAESVALVHRDIKPANVFLCRYGEDYDFVKVLDFGIVKALHGPGAVGHAPTVPPLTAEHVVQGTPAFISPEQAIGSRPVDHRADIYGIGCLAYWLLTGQLVFTGDTPLQLIVKHAQATPEPPSTRSAIPVPPELDAVILACLAKDPADRPQSARDLARRLDAVPLSGPWTPDLARAWWERHQPAPDHTAPAMAG